MPPIYLDYNASTHIDPAVAGAMRPFLDEAFGNPSSGHWATMPPKVALERAASTGSACHSGRIELSPVLAAMNAPDRIGMVAIRFSLGRDTTSDEIDDVVARLARIVLA